jgi:hypothetical protein
MSEYIIIARDDKWRVFFDSFFDIFIFSRRRSEPQCCSEWTSTLIFRDHFCLLLYCSICKRKIVLFFLLLLLPFRWVWMSGAITHSQVIVVQFMFIFVRRTAQDSCGSLPVIIMFRPSRTFHLLLFSPLNICSLYY